MNRKSPKPQVPTQCLENPDFTLWSRVCNSHLEDMGTRKKHLSRSRDKLDEMEEDFWNDKTKLLKDHITEVFAKWPQIDKEIWSKLIIFEGHQRVAKAYARAPIVAVNNDKTPFDGLTIGLDGFENSQRSAKTKELISKLEKGVLLRMDAEGNILLLKDVSKVNVYIHEKLYRDAQPIQVHGNMDQHSVSNMNRIRKSISTQMIQAYPDRQKLQFQCLSAVTFGDEASTGKLFDSPLWILVINVIALRMIKEDPTSIVPVNKRSPRHHHIQQNEEQLYSEVHSRQIKTSAKQPPQLPPRDCPKQVCKSRAVPREFLEQVVPAPKSGSKKQNHHAMGDDPYYQGLRARVTSDFPHPKMGFYNPHHIPRYFGDSKRCFEVYTQSDTDSGFYSPRTELYVGEWE